MSNLILTPLQLWEDYDPTKEPLQVSISNYDDLGSYYYIKGYFNAERCEDGPIRVSFFGRIPKGYCKNVAIVVDDNALYRDVEEMGSLIEVDYGILFYDYCGEGRGKDPTIYPQSLYWANLNQAGDHLTKAIPSAKETCGFVWTKVLRRMITLAEQLFGEKTNVFLIGHKRGADLTWKAAAMDERVKGIVTIFNAGWTEYPIDQKSETDDLEINDERERWLTGCSTQTYAKFVKCPILFLGASNSNQTPLDRLESTISIIEESSDIKKFISPGLSCSIDKSALRLVKEWLKKTSGEEVLPEVPSFDVEVENKKVLLKLEYETYTKKAEEVIVYVSYNETDPRLRSWKRFVMPNGSDELVIPIYEDIKKLYIYINAKYEGDYYLSSLMRTYDISDKEVEISHVKKSHIIYEKKMGINNWIAEEETRSLAATPKLMPGAYDIRGVSCNRGDLTTYAIGEVEKYSDDRSNILQFDFYCEEDRDLIINLGTYEDNQLVEYAGDIKITGSKEWQKMTLDLQFFKTEDLVPLKDWNGVRKLTFKDIKGILISNILWI